jgi:superfamily I DNA/RNA helicase
MKKIDPIIWDPVDGLELEDNALAAIRAEGNTLVVAGPGAGKTELLAQKACYLLQTQACTYPRKILAISFKRDAAFNLKERVARRCGEQLSQRFDSFTFDAFAKQLLDRFRSCLPAAYRISSTYSFIEKYKYEIEDAFKAADSTYFYTKGHDYVKFLTAMSLPHDKTDPDQRVVYDAWQALILGANPKVTFPMIMRLAEYIIQLNPVLKSYLQQTYSHVFLDEFQDTTYIQYDFLQACFRGSKVNYTAVGDDKQMIMAWAGAMPNIFKLFIKDTGAQKLPLEMNFRSAPKLVNLQNYLIQELLGKTDFVRHSNRWKGDEGEVKMCLFNDQENEMQYLLQQVQTWLVHDNLPPREICILVKQKPDNYVSDLIALFDTHGIQARDESSLQDLLTEDLVIYVTNFLIVIFSNQHSMESDAVYQFLCNVHASYDDTRLLRLKKQYLKLCRNLQAKYQHVQVDDQALKDLINEIIRFTGVDKIKNAYPQYQQGNWLIQVLKQLFKYLSEKLRTNGGMLGALEALVGKNVIPVMTTHKSKGLEYHTVIFIGLEDGAFWTYRENADQDNNLVFVALSRAKYRVVFTFCKKRTFTHRQQTAIEIEKIHTLLKAFPNVEIFEQQTDE